MTLAAPKPQAPAAMPAPAAQGADFLKVGTEDTFTSRGNIGRLALRVGNPNATNSARTSLATRAAVGITSGAA